MRREPSHIQKLYFIRDMMLLPLVKGREPYHKIAQESGSSIYLGSLLIEQETSGRYKPFTLDVFVKQEAIEEKPLSIVRVVEDFELKTEFLGKKAVCRTEKNKNITLYEIPLRDFTYDLPGNDVLKKIKTIFEKLIEKQQAVYFHCKSGINRSFRCSSLFLCYREIKSGNIKTEDHLNDLILEKCAQVWDQRRCVQFERDKWAIQYTLIKKMLIEMIPDLENTASYEPDKRTKLLYELYRYRHKLHGHNHKSAMNLKLVYEKTLEANELIQNLTKNEVDFKKHITSNLTRLETIFEQHRDRQRFFFNTKGSQILKLCVDHTQKVNAAETPNSNSANN
jgi:protein-tyrosine phosphatase